MKRLSIFLFLMNLIVSFTGSGQVTFVIESLPDNHPSEDTIYIVGSFNGWNPADSDYLLKGDDRPYIKLQGTGSIAFKFTRGSWSKVEGDLTGAKVENRSYTFSGLQDTVLVSIGSWEDLSDQPLDEVVSTRASNVAIIDDHFDIPQLGRSRRIWVYLPPNYHTGDQRYPVIYMQDGQNVFDAATSFSGEWGVDEALNQLYAEADFSAIVVAIDNGGDKRIDEYAPWCNADYGGGEGVAYVDFLIHTLKPYIDGHYKTKPEATYTAIVGSSLGGLISYYAGMKYPEVFGMVGAPSPAFWFNPEIFDFTDTVALHPQTRLYFSAGGAEEAATAINMRRVADQLDSRGFSKDQIHTAVHPDMQHNEAYWRSIFTDMVRWMISLD
ncbi:MAG: alpha/beta hydrolase-fold protein [Marinoscillum sp.]|uniref:alpha/beta hydrolase n=1 Tax=Marinoscillum sp. TaxID=2024838 RepID=UPI0032F8273D